MNESARQRVRPGFLKLSLVVFVLLIPFLLFSAWDYYETARQDRLLSRIDPDGRLLRVPALNLSEDEERSERFYRAAAVLAGMDSQTSPETKARLSRLVTIARQNTWSADSLPDLHELDARYTEALDFATRAAALPFKDFLPGTSFNYQFGGVLNVQRFLGYRAMLRALSGDSAGAVDAMFVEARLARILDNGFIYWQGEDLARALERTRGNAERMKPLAGALAEVDEANDRNNAVEITRMARGVLGQRLLTLGVDSYWLYVLSRPLTNQLANDQLEIMADTLSAARRPWPDRIDQEIAVGRPIGIMTPKPLTPPEYVERAANDRASRVATFRCVRLVVAVERFRREKGLFPPGIDALVPDYLPSPLVDPFSGKSLLLKQLPDGYVAYSLGPNRRDDGGAIPEPTTVPFGATSLQDAGIRMRDR